MALLGDRRLRLYAVAVAALAAALFATTAQNDFVAIDDRTYILDNDQVQRGLSLEGMAWAFTSHRASNWHPLTWISHMLDASLFGLSPEGPHAVNALLHGLIAGLLVLLLGNLRAGAWAAGVTGLLFALHPLRVESVAWAAERKDLLASLFTVLTLIAWLRWVHRPSIGRKMAVLACYGLALMSKPTPVTLPLLLLLLDVWPLRRWRLVDIGADGALPAPEAARAGTVIPAGWGGLRQRLLEKVPLFAMAAAAAGATLWAQSAGGAVIDALRLSLPVRLGNALLSLQAYLGKTVWPSDLALPYPHRWIGAATNPMSLFWGPVVVAFVVLFVLSWGTWAVRRSHPHWIVGWAWYAITLLPMIGIVQVGVQSMADRYTYWAMIGPVWAVAIALDRSLGDRQRPRQVASVAVVAVAVALAIVSWQQIGRWRDSETLFAHSLQVTERNRVALVNYGVALADQGRWKEAETFYARAIDLAANDAQAWFNMGNVSKALEDWPTAVGRYERALSIRDPFAAAHMNLGICLMQLGRREAALEQFVAARSEREGWPDARLNEANTLLLLGRADEAEAIYTDLLRRDPDLEAAKIGLSVLRGAR